MTDDVGRQLLNLLQQEIVSAFNDAVADIVDDLVGLPVDDTFAAPYAGRILERVTPEHPVLAVLSRLSADAAPASVALHGWRDTPDDAAPRGMAYVASNGAGAVALLSVVPGGNPQLTLHASGLGGGQALQIPLPGGFTLSLSGTTADQSIEVVFHSDQPPTVAQLAAGVRVELDLTRTTSGEPLGVDGGPSISFGAVSLGGWIAGDAAGAFERGGHLTLKGGAVELTPGFLKSLLPVDLSFPLDLELRLSPGAGVVLAGSPSLRARLTGSAGRWLDLAVGIADAQSLKIAFATSLKVTLPGAPVEVQVDGLGFEFPLSLDLATPLLPDPVGLVPAIPDGVGVALDLPVVGGSGILAKIGDDLAGGLSVSIPPMTASAFGLLSPADGDRPLSFLVIMGATFPPPGIQIGFGFAISGLGGVVGINRRIDREALLRAVADGTAAQLLFPSDPVGAGRKTIEALPAIFPAKRGAVVAGPMFQLSWGGRLITLSVAVLVESAGQVRLTIVGKLVLAVPDPAAPLVFLQATFAGFIDPAEPSVMFVASLQGSHIVGAPLTGDLLLLTRGGSDPTLVISAGGFHPAFPLPRGVPALRRLSMDLCPVPWIEMRCESYFALTSNTLQLGAKLELVAEVAGCGLRGYLGFDALVQLSPFRFIADVAGGIALRVFGETLMGIHLAFHLEGPAPYLARGRGSLDLFLFEVSFDFEIGWGSPAPAISGGDVGADLRKALKQPAAWRSRGSEPRGLLLTEGAHKALADAKVVDPYGTVSVRQEVVPLAIEIQRYGGLPVPAQRWDFTTGSLGGGEPADHTTEIRADFAPGMFVPSKTDDAALTAEAFLTLRSGIEIFPQAAAGAEFRTAGLTWEDRVLARDIPMPVRESAGDQLGWGILEPALDISILDPDQWHTDEPPISVDPCPPAAAVSEWSMTGGDFTGATQLEVLQTVAEFEQPMIAVEAWMVG